jgi:hypothetical protein
MKKLFTYLFFIIFSFQTPSLADDIRDFQIEGMSIGDSLLDYFSEEKISVQKKHYFPKSKKFIGFAIRSDTYNTYEIVQFHTKDGDDKYIIYEISGKFIFKNNVKECYSRKNEIVYELKQVFPNSTIKNKKTTHTADKSGESKVISTFFYLENNNGYVRIYCTDWTKKMNYDDNLKVSITSEEFSNWLDNEAY